MDTKQTDDITAVEFLDQINSASPEQTSSPKVETISFPKGWTRLEKQAFKAMRRLGKDRAQIFWMQMGYSHGWIKTND